MIGYNGSRYRLSDDNGDGDDDDDDDKARVDPGLVSPGASVWVLNSSPRQLSRSVGSE